MSYSFSADTASASGLCLVPVEKRDPSVASSYGTGELIRFLAGQGVEQIYLGLGGTATNDGGEGLVQALGPCPVPIHCFYDVDVPFWGKGGASEMFGPQKGADEAMVRRLDDRLERLCRRYSAIAGREIRNGKGAGAAGGIGGAMDALYNARMHCGIEAYLNSCGMENLLQGADLVITGEGRADRQTLQGKVPAGVLAFVREKAPSARVILLAGRIEDREDLRREGFDDFIEVTPHNMLISQAIKKEVAIDNIHRSVQEFMARIA